MIGLFEEVKDCLFLYACGIQDYTGKGHGTAPEGRI